MVIQNQHLEVLEFIQNECSKHREYCDDCLFYDAEGKTMCLFDNHCEGEIDCPSDWDF